jgi:hypothetical protein
MAVLCQPGTRSIAPGNPHLTMEGKPEPGRQLQRLLTKRRTAALTRGADFI